MHAIYRSGFLWILLCLPLISMAQPVVTMESIDVAASETGGDTATLRFTRTGSTAQALNVFATTDPSSTVTSADYVDNNGGFFSSFGRVTIAAGETEFDLVLTPRADNLVEGDELLNLTLAPGDYDIGGPSTASVVICDDPPVITLTALTGMASETGTTDTFRYQRTGGNISQSLQVTVTFDATTTVSSADYSDSNSGFFEAFGQVTIPANSATFDLVITPTPDVIQEGDEQLDITLNAGSYLIGSPASASIVIADDPPVVSVTALTGMASETGTTDTFRFQRSGGNLNQALQVTVSFDPTTTVTSADYSDNNSGFFRSFGQVTFPAGAGVLDLVITPTPDILVEGDERLDITLAAGTYVIGDPSIASMVITDDAPVVTVTALTGSASETGTTDAFRFQRSGGNLNQALQVTVSFDPTTTVTNADYSDNNSGFFRSFGQVTIPTGADVLDLVITPTPDTLVEGDERLDITLASGSYLMGDPASAGIVIVDDAPVVSITAVQPSGVEGGRPATLRFSRVGGNLAQALQINTSIDPASTAEGADYVDNNSGFFEAFGEVTIAAGETGFDLLLSPVLDSLDEGDESLIVTLETGNYLFGDPATASVTFISSLIFIDGFEQSAPGALKKRCAIDRLEKIRPDRFHHQGDSLLDLRTGLVWLRCSPGGVYDWQGQTCASADSALSADNQRQLMDAFNRGDRGDNLGFESWRWASADELNALGLPGQGCAVR